MIVKDEAGDLPGCLESLRGTVDEIVVYDTGSTDATRRLAATAGARVLAGYWDDDFGRARNAALEMTRADWILVIDADERLDGDPSGLRAFLRAAPAGLDLLQVRVTNLIDGRPADTLASVRIARRAAVRWEGTVHEQLRATAEPDERQRALAPGPSRILHHGYADQRAVRAKSERNLALARAQLDRLVAGGRPDPDAVARVLLDLGRSAVGAGLRQDAVDAFETLREVVPGGMQRAQGTGLLAQLLLDEGGFDEVVLVLEAELRDGGAAARGYCDWLRAQALARLGRAGEALELLRGIGSLSDPVGNQLPVAVVLVARTLLAAATGHPEEAGNALLEAMLEHGAAAEQHGLLAQLWAGREAELDRRLAAHTGPYAAGVRSQLMACAPNG